MSADPIEQPRGSSPQAPAAPKWRAPLILVVYAAFVSNLLLLGPGELGDLGAIGQILQGHSEEVNNLFLAIFFGLGQTGIVYAGLLMPAAGKQNGLLNTLFFSISGTVFGFGGIAPYLAFRQYAPRIVAEDVEEAGLAARWFNSRAFALTAVAGALYVYYLGLGFSAGFDAPSELRDVIFYACWQDTSRLFATDRGVNATLIDGVILSVGMWGPLTEDMRRRGWKFDKFNISSYVNAACILAAPCLGPAVYLLARPALPRGLAPLETQNLD
jgi:hypothetical protein